MNRDLQDYLGPPYGRVWEWHDEDAEPCWVVRLEEIPEVVGDGASRRDAEVALRHCLADSVMYRRADGLTLPEPAPRAAAG